MESKTDRLKSCCITDDEQFKIKWNQIVDNWDGREREWIESLRRQGVKAAHPDDGWVDRKINKVSFCYPQFNDGVKGGDIIALGNHLKHRLVKVWLVKPWKIQFCDNAVDYFFKEKI